MPAVVPAWGSRAIQQAQAVSGWPGPESSLLQELRCPGALGKRLVYEPRSQLVTVKHNHLKPLKPCHNLSRSHQTALSCSRSLQVDPVSHPL